MRVRNLIRGVYRKILPIVFSKQNYKFFLHGDFWNLEQRTRQILCAIDFFPSLITPVRLEAPFGKNVLIIAPHQDDEVIGCGGAMVLQSLKGQPPHVLFVYAGGDEYRQLGYSTPDDLVHVGEAEASKVCAALKIPPPAFLRIRDNNEPSKIAEGIYKTIERIQPDTIFSPFFFDNNREHQTTAWALAEALERTSKKQRIITYEVWGLCIPNVIVKIDDVIGDKKRLLDIYISQIKGTDYKNSVVGLNMYHSRVFGAGEGKYAENYFEVPASEYCHLIKKIHKCS